MHRCKCGAKIRDPGESMCIACRDERTSQSFTLKRKRFSDPWMY